MRPVPTVPTVPTTKYDVRAEIARILAAGQHAVAGVTATTDEGELPHLGDTR